MNPSPPARESGDPGLAAGVLAGERRALAKAITLVESSRREHQLRAQRLLEAMLLCEAAGYGMIVVETVGVGLAQEQD